jgi:hypothetical protein
MGRKSLNIDLLPMTPENKRRLSVWLATTDGDYSISIEPRRGTRSQRANAYYWSCIATPFAEFLSESGIRKFSKEQAHWIIKAATLPPVVVVNPKTGEVIREIPSDTHTMKTNEFMDFVDRARAYLADEYKVVTPDPDPTWREKCEIAKV